MTLLSYVLVSRHRTGAGVSSMNDASMMVQPFPQCNAGLSVCALPPWVCRVRALGQEREGVRLVGRLGDSGALDPTGHCIANMGRERGNSPILRVS